MLQKVLVAVHFLLVFQLNCLQFNQIFKIQIRPFIITNGITMSHLPTNICQNFFFQLEQQTDRKLNKQFLEKIILVTKLNGACTPVIETLNPEF